MVVGVLTHYALLHSICDLKAMYMNVPCSLIQVFMLYKFEQGHHAAKSTKNICCVKGWRHIDHSIDGSRNFTQIARTLVIRQGQA